MWFDQIRFEIKVSQDHPKRNLLIYIHNFKYLKEGKAKAKQNKNDSFSHYINILKNTILITINQSNNALGEI